ncbi:hypothetical protein [Burkholderia sp. Ac-20365]|uniref:hypothetical protein n=1 Tax=Burkholderia sp. Ac-20365 TaxID=2703897 RepID=UPI00197C2587|nr:hypothetical protein [Burkholderia sp. Ac-20365]MBN3760923.1 hypothetical protein [Burkholderia sp. Ac-20365]
MSKEKREANKQRAELQNTVRRLEARLQSASNTLARERYAKELSEAKRQLVRLN